jgi:SecD/SecF fusion protein
MTDAEVQKVIRRKVDESVESAFGVLRKRIDKFGVTQPNIKKESLDKFLLNFWC